MLKLNFNSLLVSLVILKSLAPTVIIADEAAFEEISAEENTQMFDDESSKGASADEAVVIEESSSDDNLVLEKSSKKAAKAVKKSAKASKKASKKAAKAAEESKKEVVAETKVAEKAPIAEAKETPKAEEKKAIVEEAPQAAAAPVVSEAAAPAVEAITLHDGSEINLSELGLSITPPKGWEVSNKKSGLTLFMQKHGAAKEIKAEGDKSVEVSYTPNISVAVNYYALPMDDKLSSEFKKLLTDHYNKLTSISNFSIADEPKMIEMVGGKKSLVIFSSYDVNGVKIGQMHLVASGKDKSFLISYSDLADHFMGATQDQTYNEAWSTLSSIKVDTNAPIRFLKEALVAGSVLLSLLLGVSLFIFARGRTMKKVMKLASYDECFLSDGSSVEPITQVHFIGYNKKHKNELEEEMMISSFEKIIDDSDEDLSKFVSKKRARR